MRTLFGLNKAALQSNLQMTILLIAGNSLRRQSAAKLEIIKEKLYEQIIR